MKIRPIHAVISGLIMLLLLSTLFIRLHRWEIALAECGSSHACYTELVLQKIRTGGLSQGFRLLEELYNADPVFRGSCHAFTLRLSAELYESNRDFESLMLTPVTAVCNYGFYQQYPASLLTNQKDVTQAKRFCTRVGASLHDSVPGAEAECYRGVGRGLPFIDEQAQGNPKKMAASAVRICKELSLSADSYALCLSGVFNSIARAEVAGIGGLVVEDDAMRLCKLQTDNEVRAACFGNYKAAVVESTSTDDIEEAQRYILEEYGAVDVNTIRPAIWTIGYKIGQYKLTLGRDFESAVDLCSKLQDVYVKDCIQGVGVGIAKHGTPGKQYKAITAFCAAARDLLPELEPGDCPSPQTLEYLEGIYSGHAFKAALTYMERRLGSLD